MSKESKTTVWQKENDNNKFTNNRYDIYNPTFNSFFKDQKREEFQNKFEVYKDEYIKFVSWAKAYPDCFLDLITPPDSKFRLFAYQRFLLRIIFRYNNVFITATRGFSKSFIEILAFLLLGIFYPRIRLSITAGGSKEQAKNIASQKLKEILELWPMLASEIKSKKESQDTLEVTMQNGSVLLVVAASNNSRGLRSHKGCIEEAILINSEILNSVIIPLFNVDRICSNGLTDPDEKSSLVYVTTAGYGGTDIYNKMIHIFNEMCRGEDSICIGSSYELPVYHGLLKQDKIDAILRDPNYSSVTFDAEYKSKWVNFSNKAYFNLNELNQCRILKQSELYSDFKKHPEDIFVLSFDVARSGGSSNDASIMCVFRCTEKKDGTYVKNLIYMKSYEDINKNNTSIKSIMHFKNQCLEIKRHVEIFNPKAVCLDALGTGAGLLDYLTDTTEDEEYGKTYPAYKVVSVNGEDIPNDYNNNGIPIMHLIKTSGASATTIMNDMNNILKGHIQTKQLKLLVDEREVQNSPIKNTQKTKVELSNDIDILSPHIQTTLLINELMQLEVDLQGTNIRLKPLTNNMRKDRYSSVVYGLWWIVRYLEDKNKKNKNTLLEDYMYFLSAGI